MKRMYDPLRDDRETICSFLGSSHDYYTLDHVFLALERLKCSLNIDPTMVKEKYTVIIHNEELDSYNIATDLSLEVAITRCLAQIIRKLNV